MTFEGNNYFVSDRYVESGNYVKLQTVEFGYTFPKKLDAKSAYPEFEIVLLR